MTDPEGRRGPANRCLTCAHPRLADIDELLRRDVPFATISRRMDVSARSLRGHFGDGHVPPAPEGPPSVESVRGGGDADPARALQDVLNALVAQDTATMSESARTRHADQVRRAAESLAKMQPEDVDSRVRELTEERDGLLTRSRAVATVLERFPEARSAVAEALRALRTAP